METVPTAMASVAPAAAPAPVAPVAGTSLALRPEGPSGPTSGQPVVRIAPAASRPVRSKLRRTLVATDAAAAAGSWAAVLAVGGAGVAPTTLAAGVGGLTLATLGLLHLNQLYLARICRIRAVEVSRLARVAVLVGILAYLAGGRVPIAMTAGTAAAGAATSFVVIAAARSVYTSWLKRMRSHGKASRPVVIVGANEEGRHLRRHFEGHPELGLVVAETVRRASDAQAALRRHDADSVVIAVSALSKAELNGLTRRLLESGVHVHLSCGLAGVDHRRLRPAPMAHEPLFYVEPVQVSSTQVVLSRALDIVGSVVGLVLSLPVLVAAAVAIKVHDRGPALFRHQRIGRDGRPFTLFKLRTMVPDAESRIAAVQQANRRDGPLLKVANDPRVTRVGRLLRATSIDELPQLFNVLRGTMSLVGPRPALASEVAQFDEELLGRLRVKPGITGLWQVEARHDPSFDSYRRLDLFYIENWSIELDLVILVSTLKGLLGQALRDLRGQWRSSCPTRVPADVVEAEGAPAVVVV